MIDKIVNSITEDGLKGFGKRAGKYVAKKLKTQNTAEYYKDILFISGCWDDLPHPKRYRVSHQCEQLEMYNISTDTIYFPNLSLDMVRCYRAFIFFRCPLTEKIGQFVDMAKKLNKTVIYDVDDLVIDTKYTNQIPFVQNMSIQDKQAYDKNVDNMKNLLKKCDFAITSTNCLQKELGNYISDIIINRNVASEEMVLLSKQALNLKRADKTDKVKIGYFSGSITHNADLEMILPVLSNLMMKYDNIELYFAGELTIPEKLKAYQERINFAPFCDWKNLPEMIADIDINLAPLEKSVFNEAKSENKWVEAALVKTVTVASDIGAFHNMIQSGITGMLCSSLEEWQESLEKLILNSAFRKEIADNAYKYCIRHCTTIKSAYGFATSIKEKIVSNYAFVLPGLEISGGIKVALKHAAFMQKHNKDVSLFLLNSKERWYKFEGCIFPVISLKDVNIQGNIGCAVATMWTTVKFLEDYCNINRRCYLVQNYETGFYEEDNPLRMQANKSYSPHSNIEFLTISKWCQRWLLDDYGHKAQYAPNGLDIELFPCSLRKMKGKIRILIEGDCAVEYKNVDEAFHIVDLLDENKFEIWYMSYNAEPKEWYRVNKFLHKIPYDKVPEVYSQCDILLKTSLLESFSYPPLEMMATGGYVVAVPNGGTVEYLVDEENCLFYSPGNYYEAKEKIERLLEEEELRERMFDNGRKTAESREWNSIQNQIMELYV